MEAVGDAAEYRTINGLARAENRLSEGKTAPRPCPDKEFAVKPGARINLTLAKSMPQPLHEQGERGCGSPKANFTIAVNDKDQEENHGQRRFRPSHHIESPRLYGTRRGQQFQATRLERDAR
jgi:hypothetical protein